MTPRTQPMVRGSDPPFQKGKGWRMKICAPGGLTGFVDLEYDVEGPKDYMFFIPPIGQSPTSNTEAET